jgi:hypothetical protein
MTNVSTLFFGTVGMYTFMYLVALYDLYVDRNQGKQFYTYTNKYVIYIYAPGYIIYR